MVTVFDKATGEALQGAQVELLPGHPEYRAWTDINGQAIIRNIVPDPYIVEITLDGYEDYQSKSVNIIERELRQLGEIRIDGIGSVEVSNDTLEFGMDGESASFSLSNTGKGVLSYAITTSEDWITADPSKGDILDASQIIRITIDRSKITTPTTIKEELTITSKDEPGNIDLFINRIEDIDGNYYSIVNIENPTTGNLSTWMTENLNTTRTHSGETIKGTHIVGDGDGRLLAKPADPDYYGKYGLYYPWESVFNSKIQPETQGICPYGWHVPDTSEMNSSFIDLSYEDLALDGETGFEAAMTGHWYSFSGTVELNQYGYWWSSHAETFMELDYGLPWKFNSIQVWDSLTQLNGNKYDYAFPVRCIRDTALVME